jgi:hypothetical protein
MLNNLGLEVRSNLVKKVTNEKIRRNTWQVEKLLLIQTKL